MQQRLQPEQSSSSAAPSTAGAAGILERLGDAAVGRRSLIIAAMAAVSALLSQYASEDSEILGLRIFTLRDVPILPAFYFGMVVSIALKLWARRTAFEILAVYFLTIVAWFCAFKTAVHIHESLARMISEIAGKEVYSADFLPGIAGIGGGLVGGAGVAFALAIVCREFRSFENWIRIVALGTVFGPLVELGSHASSLAIHIGTLLPLFLAWQISVAVAIVYGLVPRDEAAK